MASPAPSTARAEIFQASLAVERQWLREVVRAVLSTILFHRVLGNIPPTQLDVLGVAFPAIATPEVEEFVAAKTELVMKVLAGGSGFNGEGKRAKLYVSLYPTPLPHLPLSAAPLSPSTPNSASTARPSSPSVPSSPSPTRGSLRRPASLAHAAPAAVTSALGWFSASARAALSGGDGHAAAGVSSGAGGAGGEESQGTQVGQEEELKTLERLRAEGKEPWEGWCVDFEVLKEGSGARLRGPAEAEERLRAQLNDFLLRSLNFAMLKASHVPPITTADLIPFGVLILIDPPSAPFTVPKPVVSELKAFPALHKTLIAGGGRPEERYGAIRRAASAGGRW
ncbi:hypothetical protein JCM6882_004810 [Rhodosporidiobolus microsporus]